MAARIHYLAFLIVFTLIQISSGEVLEVTDSNLDSIRKGHPFLALFMTTKDCRKCRTLFPKFMAASQPFKDDQDLAFGRVYDADLADKLSVNKFPSVLFIHKGSKEPYVHEGDITVDTITEFVARRMGGDFSTVRRQYTTDVSSGNYKTITEIPNLFKMLLLYKREHSEDVALFDSVARIFKNDDEVIFLRMDIVREKRALENFEAKNFPALYWYENDEKPEKARYGGRMDKIQIMEFIKDQSGLQRKRDGDLPDNAGIIKEMDALVQRSVRNINSVRNLKHIISEAKKIAEYHKQKDLANYYVYLLEDIEDAQSLDVIDDERTALNRAIAEDQSPKTKDALKRRRNIVMSIVDAIGLHLYGGKDSPIVLKRENKRFDLQVDQEIELVDEGVDTRKGGKEVRTKKGDQKLKEHRKEHIHLHEEL